MSFNAFPIPDILEQLKSPVVDDKIHDIAERKHVFEGPMRLSPGRMYFYFVLAERETAETAASGYITVGTLNISYHEARIGEQYWRGAGLIYVPEEDYVIARTTANSNSGNEHTAQHGGTDYISNRNVSSLLLDFASVYFTVKEFYVVEV